VSAAAAALRAAGVIEATLIPVLTDPGRIAAMSARASAAVGPDAGVVLARHVLTVVDEQRRLAFVSRRWAAAARRAVAP
jgi:UDP-N-acetylglucosamine--N-acetylmuramyl-(pentapeptide) pyrophosphoryl-undecaprenol N-acetylglucosamine transferase